MTGSIVLTMFSGSLIGVSFSNNAGYSLEVGIIWAWILIALGVIIGVLVVAKFLSFLYSVFSGYISNEVKLTFIFGEATIKRSLLNKEIAHRIWAEIMTRKAGVPFDKDNDIIIEIYDSWYELFKTTREVLSKIPGDDISKKEVKPLVDILIRTLNEGLRPHLTIWQGKFRRWYNNQEKLTENQDKSPQEIQQLYPEYIEIIRDIKRVNKLMLDFANELKKISEE